MRHVFSSTPVVSSLLAVAMTGYPPFGVDEVVEVSLTFVDVSLGGGGEPREVVPLLGEVLRDEVHQV